MGVVGLLHLIGPHWLHEMTQYFLEDLFEMDYMLMNESLFFLPSQV